MPNSKSEQQTTRDVRQDRKFSVSANRGGAKHRLRYVEAGGAAVDTEECTFCESVPDLSSGSSAKSTDSEGKG